MSTAAAPVRFYVSLQPNVVAFSIRVDDPYKSVLTESILNFLLERKLVRTPSEGRHFLSMGLVSRKNGSDWKSVSAPDAFMRPGYWRVWRRGYVKILDDGRVESIRLTTAAK